MTVCGFGVGTSLLLKMTVDSILEEEGINGDRRASKWKTCLYIKLYG